MQPEPGRATAHVGLFGNGSPSGAKLQRQLAAVGIRMRVFQEFL